MRLSFFPPGIFLSPSLLLELSPLPVEITIHFAVSDSCKNHENSQHPASDNEIILFNENLT